MAEESTRDKTIGSILGDTSLQLMEEQVERSTEFEDSLLGKALFYGPSMIMGARIGGSIADTASPLTEFFKQRKDAKAEFKNNPELQELHGGSDNRAFRNYFKTQRLKTGAVARGTERGEDMLVGDIKGEGAVNSVVDSVMKAEGFTSGASTVAVENNNPGNLQWFEGIENKYKGASKGESYKDAQGITRFHTKFDSLESGKAALKDVVARKWSESNQDANVFAQNYTGLSSGEELSNYVKIIQGDLQTNNPTANLGVRSGKNLIDRNKIRAFYLNGMKDYEYDPQTNTTNQTTPVVNVKPLIGGNDIISGIPGTNMMDYGNNGYSLIDPSNIPASQTKGNTQFGQQLNSGMNTLKELYSRGADKAISAMDFYKSNKEASDQNVKTAVTNYFGARFGFGGNE
tara:strand:+ start:613 stop:1818 length:1206 start_codon:yes stop_codon:yes gene_type:complete